MMTMAVWAWHQSTASKIKGYHDFYSDLNCYIETPLLILVRSYILLSAKLLITDKSYNDKKIIPYDDDVFSIDSVFFVLNFSRSEMCNIELPKG